MILSASIAPRKGIGGTATHPATRHPWDETPHIPMISRNPENPGAAFPCKPFPTGH